MKHINQNKKGFFFRPSTRKKYPAIIEKNELGTFDIYFPDFPSCFSTASTITEAYDMAEDALQGHVDSMLDHKELMPNASDMETVKKDNKKAYNITLISINTQRSVSKKRINITLHEDKLSVIDSYAKKAHTNRSDFLEDSAICYINSHPL